MRKRPFALILSSCIFLYFPFSLVLDLSKGLPVYPSEWFLGGLLPLILTIGLLRVTRVAWYTLFCFVFLWGVRDFREYQNQQVPLAKVVTHLGVYLLGVSYFINPRIRRLYFDPKSRQWRTKRRFETHGPAILFKSEKVIYPSLRNISEGGCFLETPHLLEFSEQVDVLIPLPYEVELSSLKLKGEVRWVSDKTERTGMGIQFHSINPATRQAIKKYVNQLA